MTKRLNYYLELSVSCHKITKRQMPNFQTFCRILIRKMFVAIYTGEFTHMSSALEPLILARLEFHSQHLRVNFSFLFDFFFSESSH